MFEQRVYVYRVERPVRGTLAVVNHGSRWALSEFRQARNKPVPAEVAQQVYAELTRTRGVLPRLVAPPGAMMDGLRVKV